MPLSWNEIRTRAITFVKEWEGETRERAEKDSFYNDFFDVFGITRRRVASFEEPVKNLSENYGFIDLFWKGKLLVEHKSKGKDLDKAYSQALDYFHGLKERDLPKYVLVSDFDKFKLFDLDESTASEFTLNEFADNIHLFGFIAGYEKRIIEEEDPVNIEAAEKMGKLHDRLKEIGYEGHELEVYLVRLLFCLFADDTGIFNTGIFQEYINTFTSEDGSDLGSHLAQLFQVLNTPNDKRQKTLNEALNEFPYVNGSLFEENLSIASFDSKMREILLDAGSMDWGEISPAIFGSMFQAALDPKERRNMGAHYTSEKNILKVIKPLFLDDLWEEFEKCKKSNKKLEDLHNKIASLHFLDPACGSGNFLIITYRELRLLELEILRLLNKSGQTVLDISILLKVSIDQFYGIEIDEFASRVAEVGMWLIEHQMNEKLSLEFGQNIINLPLKGSANIVNANALRIDWEDVVSKETLNYIIGNPPFYGSKNQTKEQKEDMKFILGDIKGSGVLDFVAGWYFKSASLICDSRIKCAFVSTNSITQGEQVGVLWNNLITKFGIIIHFAHRTFNWKNKAKFNAAVHVVIIGFATFDSKSKRLFDYTNINDEPYELKVENINPYLIEGANSIVLSRSKPICDVEEVVRGSETTDKGNLLLSQEEKDYLIKNHTDTEKIIKTFQGGGDIINNRKRYCLWLKDINPNEYRHIPLIIEKINKVRKYRINSKKERTRKWADFPTLFTEDRQPNSDFLAIPKVSSERRKYIPIAYLPKSIIINNTVSALKNASDWYFGIISSIMHMTWVKYTCGRMKSDYVYSIQIVYNNFPWPPEIKEKKNVESKANQVLKIREMYPDSSLADLYDPLTMPPNLVKAHSELDKAVDKCYRSKPFKDERERIEFLFELYEEYTNPLSID